MKSDVSFNNYIGGMREGMEKEILKMNSEVKKVSRLSKIAIVLTLISIGIYFIAQLLGIQSVGQVLVVCSLISSLFGLIIAVIDVFGKNRKKVFSIIIILLNGLWVGFFGILLMLVKMFSKPI